MPMITAHVSLFIGTAVQSADYTPLSGVLTYVIACSCFVRKLLHFIESIHLTLTCLDT